MALRDKAHDSIKISNGRKAYLPQAIDRAPTSNMGFAAF